MNEEEYKEEAEQWGGVWDQEEETLTYQPDQLLFYVYMNDYSLLYPKDPNPIRPEFAITPEKQFRAEGHQSDESIVCDALDNADCFDLAENVYEFPDTIKTEADGVALLLSLGLKQDAAFDAFMTR